MKISVFGLGYVGCVSAACLANDGHQVIGVDINPLKVEQVLSGHSPIIEPGLDELIKSVREDDSLCATTDSREAILTTEISLVCVGTPSNDNGSLKLDYVKSVCREIGQLLREKDEYHTVVIRSTVLPGTVDEQLRPILEEVSGKTAGVEFGLCTNPEFLRESSAISDYYKPSYIIIGESDGRSGALVAEMYTAVPAPVFHMPIRSAEMFKYINNIFHALKVSFANEVGTMCKAEGIDGQELMKVFCQDTQLNIAPTYLRPGFAFGGSCLPKDTRALNYRAKELDLNLPVLNSVLESNEKHIQWGIKMVERTGRKKIGVFGLSFKSGTDDVRESPVVPLIETLVGRGYQVRIYDEQVELSKLIGANKAYLESEIPHITSLMSASVQEVLDQSEVVVVTNGSEAFCEIPERLREDQVLIDFVGKLKEHQPFGGQYEGICW